MRAAHETGVAAVGVVGLPVTLLLVVVEVAVHLDTDSRRDSCQPILLLLDVPHPAQGGHNLEGETHDSVSLRRGLLL